MRIGIGAIFMTLMIVTTPLYSIQSPGDFHSSEELEAGQSIRSHTYGHEPNYPGFQEGSIFSDSVMSIGGSSSCIIMDVPPYNYSHGSPWPVPTEGAMHCWGTQQAEWNSYWSGAAGRMITAVSMSETHLCTLTKQGFLSLTFINSYNNYEMDADSKFDSLNSSVICWMDEGGTWGSFESISLPGPGPAVAISAGNGFSCAIIADSTVSCWGANGEGQLGVGDRNQYPNPTTVSLPNGSRAVAISAGGNHACAILNNGSTMCWGDNTEGQLGDGSQTDRLTPVVVSIPNGRKAVAISAGIGFTCAILDNMSLSCWGDNSRGQLADGTSIDRSLPTFSELGVDNGVISISSGEIHACAVIANGSAMCWGGNNYGQLGIGVSTGEQDVGFSPPSFVNLPAGLTANAISAANSHTCATVSSNFSTMLCWGDNSGYQLGEGTNTQRTTPTHIRPEWGLGCASTSNHHTGLTLPCTIPIGDRDLDGDGVLNIFDTNIAGDEDGDGVPAPEDQFPSNPVRSSWCPSGTFGRYSCSNASHGLFAEGGGLEQYLCPRGTYQPNQGQGYCLDASPGMHTTLPGMYYPEMCPTYMYQSEPGQPICILADAGHYVIGIRFDDPSGVGATNQTPCPLGFYQPEAGQYSCIAAEPGWYVDSTAATSQTSCEFGHYSTGSAALECVEAGAGYYVPTTGASGQTMCAAGTWQNQTGQSTCIETDPGYVVTGLPVAQTPCEPGTYGGGRISFYCHNATRGTYVPSYASSFPTNTSIGFYTVQDWRNIEETPCPDNHITWSVDPWDIGQGLGLDAILETTHPMGGASIEDCVIDSDSDEIPDWVENWDADGDGVPDKDDAWPFDPCVSLDYDSDGLADLLYYVEECETSVFPDIDHDNDWVKDTDDFCWYGDLNWTSGAVLGTDHDGDGCRDDGEDTDDDGDGVEDADDQCPRGHIGWISNPMNDIDGDGCHEIEDYDRDGDGFNDIEDAFPNDPTEWLDSDGDGVGDNAEKEKVEDGGTDYLLVISIFLSLAAVVIIVSKRKFS